ncbi:hypothetical protein BX600DRAFT_473337 [Xylariales sp. PMI_506]|nr:hypothetical protein BX600DRAFT_473337 [Xylariales sp. PMI_506]
MHHQRSEPVREVKLRAACDRCHDLKNRCVRAGGLESRCERCERLDIDCVYRNSSSMGRPRRQKRPAAVPARHSSQDTRPRMMHDKTPETAVTDGGAHELDESHMEADTIPSGSTTLNDLPWDTTSLLMSPEGPRLVEQYWGADFCHYNNIHDPLFQFQEANQPPHMVQQSGLSENHGLCSKGPASSDPNRKEPTATLISRLFQLQGHLCRLLLAGDGQPGFEYVQEGLEASKSFLDILQAGIASQDGLPMHPAVSPGDREANASVPVPLESSEISNATSENDTFIEPRQEASPMSYIVVQQALTCYLYVLLLLDRVVGLLTSRAGGRDAHVSVSHESPALHLGVFSLASQPALNNEIVLHLILRLVQHLQAIIRMLASKCKELADELDETSTNGNSESESSEKQKPLPASLAAVLHGMSDLVIRRERLLVERLLSLTGAT